MLSFRSLNFWWPVPSIYSSLQACCLTVCPGWLFLDQCVHSCLWCFFCPACFWLISDQFPLSASSVPWLTYLSGDRIKEATHLSQHSSKFVLADLIALKTHQSFLNQDRKARCLNCSLILARVIAVQLLLFKSSALTCYTPLFLLVWFISNTRCLAWEKKHRVASRSSPTARVLTAVWSFKAHTLTFSSWKKEIVKPGFSRHSLAVLVRLIHHVIKTM